MRQKLSVILICFGVLMLIGAAGLLLHNEQEAEEAAFFAAQVLPELAEQASQAAETAEEAGIVVGDLYVRDPKEFARPWPTGEVEGNSYLGILSIPSIGYETPVLADCTEALLKLGACRFYGEVYGEPLVLCAHNYERLYSRLAALHVDDPVYFTDMYGCTWTYLVAELQTLEPEMVTEMNSSDYDFTFFTCTYGGQARLTLRCVKP